MDMMEMFRQTYLEESFEGLQVMESGLLNLPLGNPDKEQVNTIFRAAHSIKGGSGTFGFSEISGFTHVLETLLDEVRSDKRDVTQDGITVMLESVDVLRDMLTRLQNHEPIDSERASRVQAQLEAVLAGTDVASAAAAPVAVAAAPAPVVHKPAGWAIELKPEQDLLRTGNEPLRILRELEGLGSVKVTLHEEQLPAWSDYDPESLYWWWSLELTGEDISEAQVKEVFEWIDGDGAEVNITPLTQSAGADVVGGDDMADALASITQALTPETPASAAPAVPATAARKPAAAAQAPAPQQESSIRVNISKIDHLVNLVGELVITQSMLSQFGDTAEESRSKADWIDKLKEGLSHLERHTRELQESVMNIRMLPISFSFNRMPRIVHDTSLKLGKKIDLVMEGENTEVDKTVLEQLTDPLVHIVRNSIDHGIEMPAARKEKGKPETGTVKMSAFHQGGNIVIQITDDGAGINLEKVKSKAIEKGVIDGAGNYTDAEIVDLIFHPGFSTADQISDISGRGVGMDVVRRNIRSLGGTVDVETRQGVGSIFTIRLPLTLAILDGQLSSVGSQTYVFPLVSIVESIQTNSENIKTVTGTELFKLRDTYIPIVRLYQQFNLQDGAKSLEEGLLVVVESSGKRVGIFVDDLQGQQQVVIKSLETNFIKVDGVAGATILGDGTVALILDITELVAKVDDHRHLAAA